MNYNTILNIPERALINKRLTKTFFLRNFELSTAEKKFLNNDVLGMSWLASIKTSNSNIPEFKDDKYQFEELQVMIVTLNNKLNELHKRAFELLQKYIPYQLFIIVEDTEEFIINVCDKRINLNDKSKRTIEAYYTTSIISKLYKNEITSKFYESLSFTHLNKTNLKTAYTSWTQAIIQYKAACLTGQFQNKSQYRTEEDMNLLLKIERIEQEIISLTSQIKKESQLNAKVDLNIKIQQSRKEIEAIKNTLSQA